MKKSRYRIYTENCQDQRYDQQLSAIRKYFDGFTVLYGTGYWKGAAEHSLIFEIIGENSVEIRAKIIELAETIRDVGKQETVLVTAESVMCEFV